MPDCEFESRLSAYHDDELPPADREAVEAHLGGCAACAADLASLAATSAMFKVDARAMPQISRHRLHRRLDRQMERGLLRLTWAMSGAAAAIVVAGSLWLTTMKNPPQAPPPWVEAVADSGTPAAQWYLADASSASNDEW